MWYKIIGEPDTKISPQGSGNIKMNKNEVTTLTSLVDEGKKIARLSGNRDLNEKIVKAKMKTLEECGQLIPAIVVDATDVMNQGLEVVDFTTGDIIREEEAVDYLVLVEGNHRYEAHLRLMASNEERDEQKRYKREFKLLYALNTELPIAKMLSEINIATNPWKGSDYVKGAKINNQQKKLPLLDAMNNLVNKGYSLTSASKWLTFTSRINKKVMDCAIDGNIVDELNNTSGLKRGIRLLQAAEGIFKETTIQARTVIDWIISKYEKTSDNLKPEFTDKMERFLKNISEEDADYIEKAKGTKGGDTKENIINNKLYPLSLIVAGFVGLGTRIRPLEGAFDRLAVVFHRASNGADAQDLAKGDWRCGDLAVQHGNDLVLRDDFNGQEHVLIVVRGDLDAYGSDGTFGLRFDSRDSQLELIV